ncbi:mechanosensitive ion channel domain-containing protein [Altericista sp. CCNU0014]|uniref:mechanosensitive ion channel domain-containing protein n=1 Tax=Altericista sp. CCNU0014 TaxID=3082949 RepID=UPI00384ECAD9
MMNRPLLFQVAFVLAILGLSYWGHWFFGILLRRFRRWSEQHLHPAERLWTELGGVLLLLLLRGGLWLLAIAILLSQIPFLKPFSKVLDTELSGQFGRWVTKPAINLGRTQLSLSTVVTAILAAIAIFIGARLLSQSIKTWVLGQSRMDRGMQEAISALITYALAILGLVILLQTIGLDLSSLTVLAGVVGLGFGLGLQELASNFVSGLTLLFEQQIRVGDFVEIDGIAGTIEQISIRSTTLRTTDRRFAIVPNHLFSQKNVINWSYQEPVTRIHIPVAVAFGSDTVLVTETLIACARMENGVLDDPPPSVWFKAFGESAYEFELLVWIDRPQNFEPIKSSLNFSIEQELRQSGIEIPFPQRELRLRDGTRWSERGIDLKHPATTPAAAIAERASPERASYQELKSLRVLLKQVSYFKGCSDSQLRVLIEQGYRRFFRHGQIICKEGDAGECFYILLKGRVEVISEKLGQEIATIEAGGFFGEISLFTGMPRSTTVRAVEDVTLFVVDHRALKILLQDHRELAEKIAEVLAQRQQVLRELGVLSADLSQNETEAPLWWIRQRIHSLFGI